MYILYIYKTARDYRTQTACEVDGTFKDITLHMQSAPPPSIEDGLGWFFYELKNKILH